jgi:hypothetical protein
MRLINEEITRTGMYLAYDLAGAFKCRNLLQKQNDFRNQVGISIIEVSIKSLLYWNK